MLYTKLKDLPVKTPLGDKAGRLDDLIINGETWKVEHVVISEGFLKKHRIGVKPEDIQIDEDKETIVVSPEVEHIEIEEKVSSLHRLFLSDIKKKGAVTSDGEKAGNVYDLDVATELKRWEITRLLIDTGWTKRRLRIKPSEIEDMGDTLSLKLTKADIESLTRPQIEGE